MPKLWVKQSGTWKQVQRIWVKQSGAWTSVGAGIVTQSGIGKQFYPDTIAATTYTVAGTYVYTVPATVTQIEITSTGGGGGGSAYYFNAGSGNISAGGNAGSTYVTSTGLSITSGGGGGGATGTVGSNSISGVASTAINQNGGSPSGTTGGSSYFGAGSPGGGDGSTPPVPSAAGAGGGGGYYQNNATQGGYAGATQISTVNVTPGQLIYISIGSGGIGPRINYTQGSNHNSFAGDGAAGYVKIRPLTPTVITYSTPGSYTFTVPAGVTSVTLSMVGGGGNGQGNLDTSPGSGGGSGAYWQNYAVAVTPGTSISVVVGAAGSVAQANPQRGYSGAPSSFGALIAGGGEGGHWRGSNTPYPDDSQGGAGGIATGAGGVNGTKGGNAGNGTGASSPYGSGGAGSGGTGGNATGNGAGGGGGGNNVGGGSGSNGFVQLSY